MRPKNTSNICSKSFWAAVILLVSTMGCSGERSAKQTAGVATTTPREEASAQLAEYYITSLDNALIGKIALDENEVRVAIEGKELWGIQSREDKRKYRNSSDQVAFVIKYSDAGFKLRDAQEELIWKVKHYEDYLKISDNEEMQNAFRVGFSDSDKLKVKIDGEEQYVAIFDPKSAQFKMGNYNLRNFKNSLASGMLLIEEIPLKERVILAAEVLKSGQ
ncbi:MAG: hypothetical protein R8G66_14390 [Cytophagales bacterium]|nr:hypothetical protein [Cytophagales bacterium]